jgi:hypothetical protein
VSQALHLDPLVDLVRIDTDTMISEALVVASLAVESLPRMDNDKVICEISSMYPFLDQTAKCLVN